MSIQPTAKGVTVFILLALVLRAMPAAGQAGIVQQVQSVVTEAGPVVVENLADGLNHPWGMAFRPDGRLLVTERSGDLRILDNNHHELSSPVEGVPPVFAQGQGGLLEMGPLGGDELHQPQAARSYGWPVVSWGMNYDGNVWRISPLE